MSSYRKARKSNVRKKIISEARNAIYLSLLELLRKDSRKLGFEPESEYEKRDPEKRDLSLNYDYEENAPGPEAYEDSTVISRLERIQRSLTRVEKYRAYIPVLEKIIDSIEAEEDITAYKLFRKIFNEDEYLQKLLYPYFAYVSDRIEEEGKSL